MRAICALVILAMSVAFVGTGCVQSPTGPALIYMNVKGPIAAAGTTSPARIGKSCARVFLAVIAWGDASIAAAKRNGGITDVTTVDHESFNLIGFGSFCTVVHGA